MNNSRIHLQSRGFKYSLCNVLCELCRK